MIYCFDIDGTMCTSVENSHYESARPFTHVIDAINRLYDEGHVIKVMTARGSVSGVDYTDFTRRQLREWGLQYHELIMNVKPHADLFVDDRTIHIDEWVRQLKPVRGVVAGAFDLIHPGYIAMFAETKRICTHLTVLLHSNPAIERENKLAPVLDVDERRLILESIRYVDDVVDYDTERDLYELLKGGCFDVRFLGDDYRRKAITGADLPIEVHWIDRSHGYSTTSMKKAIHDSVAAKESPEKPRDGGRGLHRLASG